MRALCANKTHLFEITFLVREKKKIDLFLSESCGFGLVIGPSTTDVAEVTGFSGFLFQFFFGELRVLRKGGKCKEALVEMYVSERGMWCGLRERRAKFSSSKKNHPDRPKPAVWSERPTFHNTINHVILSISPVLLHFNLITLHPITFSFVSLLIAPSLALYGFPCRPRFF